MYAQYDDFKPTSLKEMQTAYKARERRFRQAVQKKKEAEPVLLPPTPKKSAPIVFLNPVAVRRPNVRILFEAPFEHIAQFRLWEKSQSKPRPVSAPDLIKAILSSYPKFISDCNPYSYEEIIGPRRGRDLIRVRHFCMWFVATQKPNMSYPAISREFNRDHTTVLHAVKKVSKEMGDAKVKNRKTPRRGYGKTNRKLWSAEAFQERRRYA